MIQVHTTRFASITAFCALTLLQVVACAETIRIENSSNDDFHYVIRRQQEAWSDKPLTLEANQYHTFASSEPLIITYWTDKPRFATLEPNRTYRLLDRQRGELRVVTSVLRPITPVTPAAEAATSDVADPATRNRGEDDATAQSDIRVVRVLALADNTYRRIVGQWEQRIRNAVTGASDYYEKNFRVRFVIDDIRAWDYRGLTDKPDERWTTLLKTGPGEADIVLAFIGFGDYYKGEDQAYYVGHLGQGMPFGQHVMVSGEQYVHANRDRAVLIHELAHLFGAFHVDNKSSVMQSNFNDVPTKDIIDGRLHLDAPLRELIELTREVDFRRGVTSLDPETQERIKSLCREHRRKAEKDAPDPIEQGHRYLKAREAARGEVTPSGGEGGAE